ncbi:serine hydroxymethyltransferase [Bradymonas sediminis]|uniref:Serine hydroxymethyltransferase n=1 Tax=Bradymonas sediminis TaxID=1548548 RepID=A0A2Z4FQ42_9DELT|nr:serine hydroxymethyltransferase [Bradymonas sediminis]AWV91191.1 serine hydroxymethyltransferase [Bradymonas sediminis]TDP73755.1 glycine hydroxymethyltransferase [Bradymonas sediminis]
MSDLYPEMDALKSSDPDVYAIIRDEEDRQARTIRLIASENYTSRAIMEATGSVLTNKYSEGYPGRRYYEGQEHMDRVENLARDRGKELFGAEHVNVQPYSGSPANLEAYYALCEVGDPILGMGLPFGGHLTHGWKVNFSGRFYDAHHYGVDPDTHLIDFAEVRKIAREVKPKVIFCGGSAYPREIDFDKFGEIAEEVGAHLVADIAHIAGLIAGGQHPSPIEAADVVSSTTHKTLRGPRGGLLMCKKKFAKDIDRAVFPALQGGPHMNTIAGVAIAFKEAMRPEFKTYAADIIENARAMADAFVEKGYTLVSGGTDNHLLLVDVTARGSTGKIASTAMAQAGIVCNANSIPFDPRSPFDPSGIRIGTAAVTTRGMKPAQMRQIVAWTDDAINHADDPARLAAIRAEVDAMCGEFPVP